MPAINAAPHVIHTLIAQSVLMAPTYLQEDASIVYADALYVLQTITAQVILPVITCLKRLAIIAGWAVQHVLIIIIAQSVNLTITSAMSNSYACNFCDFDYIYSTSIGSGVPKECSQPNCTSCSTNSYISRCTNCIHGYYLS